MKDRFRSLLKSLRVRLALPFVILNLAILLFLYFFVSNAAEETELQNLRDDLQNRASIAALSISEHTDGDRLDIQQRVNELARLSDARITLIDADGTVLADSVASASDMDDHNFQPEIEQARADGYGTDSRSSDSTDIESLYVAVPVPGSDGWILRISVHTTEISDAVASTRRGIVLAVVISLIVTVTASWFFAGRLAEPLEDLMRKVMRISVGDYSVRMKPYNLREVNNVGRAFNLMADRLEEEMERRQQASLRLESVMEGLLDGVILTDHDGRVLRLNPAAELMLDVLEPDAVGKPFVQVARDYEMARVLTSAFDGKDKSSTIVDHGVDHQIIQVFARVVEGYQQRLGFVVLRDVTEVRRLETVRREFMANVSHELRTPLTSIRALVETLEGGAIDEPDVATEFLGRIVAEIDRLNALVEDLLDFARLEAGRTPLNLEYANIGDVIHEGVSRLRQQIERAGLSIDVELAENLPEMPVDTGRIEQVLINLIHNAIKFTPAGGSLMLRAWREKNTVYVALKDTGVGILEAEQSRLFERFYKSDKARRSEGTGLGLAIAQNIVRLHGGRITVESAPGEGSEFMFTLPIKRKKAARRARKHSLRGLV